MVNICKNNFCYCISVAFTISVLSTCTDVLLCSLFIDKYIWIRFRLVYKKKIDNGVLLIRMYSVRIMNFSYLQSTVILMLMQSWNLSVFQSGTGGAKCISGWCGCVAWSWQWWRLWWCGQSVCSLSRTPSCPCLLCSSTLLNTTMTMYLLR